MPSATRRTFLKQTSAQAVLGSALALGGVQTARSANNGVVRLGLIGCGGIMHFHLEGLLARKEGIAIKWLCDVDPRHLESAVRQMNASQAPAARTTARFEDVLEDDDVDACIIGTPHHWHAPIAIRAMQAGKDVYIEKPMSHVYNEGPLLIAAAKKYGRVVQQGSQMRNSPVTLKAEGLLKSGIIGEIKVARTWTAETREEFKAAPDSAPPEGVDYDRWLGPAPLRPFNERRFHGSWRMFRDYGNGEIGDDGIHDLDMAAWGLDVAGLPAKITARGGRMMAFANCSEYPDNMHVAFEYPDGRLLLYENYSFTAYGLHGFDNGNAFYGTDGFMIFSRRGAFNVYLGPKAERGPTEGKELRGQQGYVEHMDEFLRGVRERTPTKASAETAHRSCALVHLGEIAFRVGQTLRFDPAAERFVDCPEADALLDKAYRDPWKMPAV